MNIFLCQDCNLVIMSNKDADWEKFHITENSCPSCNSDMCGCSGCKQEANELINLYIK